MSCRFEFLIDTESILYSRLESHNHCTALYQQEGNHFVRYH